MKHVILVAAILSFIGHLLLMIYKPEFTAYGFVNIFIMAIPALLYVYLVHLRITILENEKSKKKNSGED